MKISELLSSKRINLNLTAKTKDEVILELCSIMNDGEVLTDRDIYKQDIIAREELMCTAIIPDVAIPHAKSKAVKRAAICLGISKIGIDYGGESKTRLFFMIASPDTDENVHLEALAALSALLLNNSFKNELLGANSADEIFKILDKYEKEREASENIKTNTDDGKPSIVAVTACPTGIAHTYMAEEALLAAGKKMGISIRVETNGAEGVKNKLSEEEIKNAKGVILAINRSVETARFVGKPLLQVDADVAIKEPEKLINNVLNGNVPIYKQSSEEYAETGDVAGAKSGSVYKHLMGGVSYMLPFVISGGILIALAFLIDTFTGAPAGSNFGSTNEIARLLNGIGGSAFGLFVPVLGAYIAFSIADRAGLAAGFVGGLLARDHDSGFLGAIIAGFLAGYITKYITVLLKNLPKSLNGVKAILFYPVLSVMTVGLIMQLIINPPMAVINSAMIDFLNSMHGSSRVLLGMLVAGMMAVDMGGPVNKAAYVFGTTSLEATLMSGGSEVMAAVMAGGMVPPIAIAISTMIFKKLYTLPEREAGKSNWVMGLTFITEGAIPFAAADPLRVIPACVIGSSVAGGLTMMFNIKLMAPHGGVLVMLLSNNFFLYALAIAIGSVITAILLGVFKNVSKK